MKSCRTPLGGIVILNLVLGGAIPGSAQDPPTNELVSLVVGLLGESDPDLRALAFEQVRTAAEAPRPRASSPRNCPACRRKLRSDCCALADRADRAARPAVLEQLSSPDAAVRVASIQALGTLGTQPIRRGFCNSC